MDDELRKKVKDYMQGKLSGEESEEIEKEIRRLEEYQSVLDEYMREDKKVGGPGAGLDEKKILRRGKWKARFMNAVIVLGILLGFLFVSGIFTSLFYTLGDPPRIEEYRDVVESAVAVTEPNVMVRSTGTSVGGLFTMNMEGELTKRVGGSEMRIGNISVNFLLGQGGYPERDLFLEHNISNGFIFPGENTSDEGTSDWDMLEKLPEGTVSEVYISLDRLYGTDEILKEIPQDITPAWFAVDTGFDNPSSGSSIGDVIGFPYEPLWHSGDWTVTNRKEENKGLSGKTVTETKTAPTLEAYGSGDIRNKNFIDTLKLLEKYEGIADRIAYGPGLNIKERLEYIDKHGINIYGIVVTGPTKEILKLEDKSWAACMKLGEARLWNLQ